MWDSEINFLKFVIFVSKLKYGTSLLVLLRPLRHPAETLSGEEVVLLEQWVTVMHDLLIAYLENKQAVFAYNVLKTIGSKNIMF